MSINLKAGDRAWTEYNGYILRVTITARLDDTRSQSKVCYQVTPALNNNDRDAWYDAGWFTELDPGAENDR